MSGRSRDEAGRIALNGYSYGIGIPRDEALRNLPGKAPDEADVVLDLIKQLAVYGGSKRLPGLVRRRRMEADLYFS